jgi:hypothetical protein
MSQARAAGRRPETLVYAALRQQAGRRRGALSRQGFQLSGYSGHGVTAKCKKSARLRFGPSARQAILRLASRAQRPRREASLFPMNPTGVTGF